MANLNFQQPPRSIASGSLGGTRVGSAAVVGFGGAAAASAVVAAGAAAVAAAPGAGSVAALSPGRAVSSAGAAPGQPGSVTAVPGGGPPMMASRATLFGQRAFADRRSAVPSGLSAPATNAMSNMSNFMGGRGSYGSGGAGVAAAAAAVAAAAGYHSVFGAGMGVGGTGGGMAGGGGDTSTPPLLDLSEFPSLTARGAGDAAPPAPTQAAPPPGTKPYVGMVKQPTSEQSEFTMSSEDFPALPGTSAGAGGSAGGAGGAGTGNPQREPPGEGERERADVGALSDSLSQASHASLAELTSKDKLHRKGIQTNLDGKVTNIPHSMIQNQFGVVGLLTFIRVAETDPELVSLALGQDLTAFGLNLNSPENLHVTFAGPWSSVPCRPQDIDYHVPPEYMINSAIREKLAPIKLNRYKDDLLFYLFYCFVGDYLQLYAAQELYNRDWRYHMEEKVWITQAPGMNMIEKTTTYERGTYYFFDAQNWRKVAKEFHLDYSKLEGRPQVPPPGQT